MTMSTGIMAADHRSLNSLDDDGIREWSKQWGSDEVISTLDVSGNDFGVVGAAALGLALKKNSSITTLDCSRNKRLGDEGAELLLPGLQTDGTGISTIRTMCLIRCGIGDAGATALAHGLRGNSVLKQLQLTGNHVGDSGASALMASLVGLSKGFLVGLWLGSNRIGPAGAVAVGDNLARSPTVRDLCLAGNAIGDIGVAALMKGVVVGQRLQGLYVGGCGVSDAGAKEVANIAQNSLHLETLSLGHCFIGDDGASALARALSGNLALRRLLLPSNHLRAAGGKAIASMLLSNAALLCLDVSDNQLGSPGIEAIATAIVKNTSLLELNLSGCGGTDASFQAVAKAVEANKTLGVLLYASNHLSTGTKSEIEFCMERAKRPARELVGQIQRAINVRNAARIEHEIVNYTGRPEASQGTEPSVALAPGQTASVQVSLGRKDNIVGSMTVTNETTLDEARVLVNSLLRASESDTFHFVSRAGGVIPTEEERAQRVVWDCEAPVRLRPTSWVAIARA